MLFERFFKKNFIIKYIRMCVFCFCCDNKNRYKGLFDFNEFFEIIMYYMIWKRVYKLIRILKIYEFVFLC